MNHPPKYAGFWKRFLAYLLDYAILGFIKFILFIPVWLFLMFGYYSEYYHPESDSYTSVSFQEYGIDESIFAFLLLLIIVLSLISIVGEWLYFSLMESSSKQGTLGKIIIGIKITDLNGNRISFGKATGRFFGKYLSGLILGIGYIMAAFTEKKQALHDILASCLVVDKINYDYLYDIQQENKSPLTN